MAFGTQGHNKRTGAIVFMIVVGDGEMVLPTEMKFAGATALAATLLAAPAARLFDFAGDVGPVQRIKHVRHLSYLIFYAF
jgi:hypothetical protein